MITRTTLSATSQRGRLYAFIWVSHFAKPVIPNKLAANDLVILSSSNRKLAGKPAGKHVENRACKELLIWNTCRISIKSKSYGALVW